MAILMSTLTPILLAFSLRRQRVPDPVPQKVKREHGQKNHQRGEENEVGVEAHGLEAVGGERAPA